MFTTALLAMTLGLTPGNPDAPRARCSPTTFSGIKTSVSSDDVLVASLRVTSKVSPVILMTNYVYSDTGQLVAMEPSTAYGAPFDSSYVLSLQLPSNTVEGRRYVWEIRASNLRGCGATRRTVFRT